jgi:hypothetical protein
MELKKEEIDQYSSGPVKLVDELSHPTGETIERGLDSNSVRELQSDTSFPEDPQFMSWTIGDLSASTIVSYRKSELERKREQQAKFKHGPDDPSIEYLLARTAMWVVTSLRTDSNLRRALNTSNPDYRVEVAEQTDRVVLNFIYWESNGSPNFAR